MALAEPAKNKMVTAPLAKKTLREWHFASDGIHEAMMVVSDTIEAAEKIYHQTKRKIGAESVAPSASEGAAPSASAEPDEKELPATNP